MSKSENQAIRDKVIDQLNRGLKYKALLYFLSTDDAPEMLSPERDFWTENALQAHPFVFMDFIHQTKFKENYRETPSLPFKMISLEVSKDCLFLTSSEGRRCVNLLAYEESPDLIQYLVFFVRNFPSKGAELGCWMPTSQSHPEMNIIVNNYLEKLKTERPVHEKIDHQLPRAVGDFYRRPSIIKNIVRIVPKKIPNEKITACYGGKLDFSHRWEVMGHWRKVDGIGKTREGKYEMQGNTWVVPHIKGPDDKLLIKKTRVVT